MDVAEEVMVVVNKGKRTKRQRPYSPVSAANLMNNTSGSSSSSGEEGDDHDRCFPSPITTTTSAEFTDSTEEEEDMANCLILLAQGQGGRRRVDDHHKRIEDEGMENYKLSNRKLIGAPAITAKNGFYVYKCKTCNRCFPSFQALGGHRASHKKPKSSVEEKKALMLVEDHETQLTNHNISTTASTTPSLGLHLGSRSPNNSNKAKVHECSVCGSEFSSGQALGGHMRRHRPSMAATAINGTNMDSITSESDQEVMIKKERNVLSLDLNLPAPEDDNRDHSKFSFNSKQQPQPPLVFSASALVDCHY